MWQHEAMRAGCASTLRFAIADFLLAAVVGASLVNLKKQNGPNSVVVLTVRAASKELMIMRNCDHNAIIVRDLSKVVKFVLTLSLLLASMSAF